MKIFLMLLISVWGIADSAFSQVEESLSTTGVRSQPELANNLDELQSPLREWLRLDLVEQLSQLRKEPNEKLLMQLIARQGSYNTRLSFMFGKLAKNMPQWQPGAKQKAIHYLAKAAQYAKNEDVLQQVILICLQNVGEFQYFKCTDKESSKWIETSVLNTQTGFAHFGHFDYSETLAVEASRALVHHLSNKSVQEISANKMPTKNRILLERAKLIAKRKKPALGQSWGTELMGIELLTTGTEETLSVPESVYRFQRGALSSSD